MKPKLKAFYLVLVALMAGIGIATSASATNGEGHFVTTETKASTLYGTEEGVHRLEFTMAGSNVGIVCDKTEYHDQMDVPTESLLVVFPVFSQCHTTGDATNIPVTVNGCHVTLTVAKGTTKDTEQTAHLVCPGAGIEIHHPNCTLRIPGQKSLTGITYTKELLNGKHAITMDFNVKPKIEYEAGLCIFLGTNQVGTLHGSLTVEAFELITQLPTGLTAT